MLRTATKRGGYCQSRSRCAEQLAQLTATRQCLPLSCCAGLRTLLRLLLWLTPLHLGLGLSLRLRLRRDQGLRRCSRQGSRSRSGDNESQRRDANVHSTANDGLRTRPKASRQHGRRVVEQLARVLSTKAPLFPRVEVATVAATARPRLIEMKVMVLVNLWIETVLRTEQEEKRWRAPKKSERASRAAATRPLGLTTQMQLLGVNSHSLQR